MKVYNPLEIDQKRARSRSARLDVNRPRDVYIGVGNMWDEIFVQ